MKFSIPRTDLLHALDMTAGAVERKSTKPILSNALIQAKDSQIQITTTDMDIEMVVTLVNSSVFVNGETTVPAKKLHDIVKTAPDDSLISLEQEGHRVKVTYGRSRFELSSLPAQEFPNLEDIKLDTIIKLTESDFSKLIHKVSFAMGAQDVRYYLNGMLLDINRQNIKGVSTDGHRLALSSCDLIDNTATADNVKIIVPRKAIQELARLLNNDAHTEVSLHIDSRHIRLNKDNIQLTSKLIDSNYPDYQMAIPDQFMKNLAFDKQQLKNAIIRVAILSNDKYKAILLNLSDGVMTLNSNNPEQESAEEKLDVNYQDEVFEVGYNATYLLDALNHLEGDTVTLNLNNDQQSTEIYSTDDMNTRYIVMPVKI